MAWSINISGEGWDDIYNALHDPEQFTEDQLINALADDDFEAIEEKSEDVVGPTPETWEILKSNYTGLAHDTLAEECYRRVEANNTCDNGGFAYWIDRQGYHKVELR